MQASTETWTRGRQCPFAIAVCGAVLALGGTSRAETPSDHGAEPPIDVSAPGAATVRAPSTAPRVSTRTVAWIVLGTGATLAVSSLVTGAFATAERANAEASCSPRCSDAQLSTGRTLATTSTVLTGAAVVATAVGAVLLFHPTSDAHPSVPNVGVDVTPSGVRASTTWRF